MNNLLVSYDLKAPGRNYKPVHDYLQGFPGWAKPLESVYLLHTSKSAIEVRNELKVKVDANDKLLVIRVDSSMWATFNLPNTANWLNTH